MRLIKFFDIVLIMFVVYLPLLIGKSKKNEESLFWASLITLVLAVISMLVMKKAQIEFKNVNFLPILISTAFGFGAYGLYKMNWKFERNIFTPLTWLVFLPLVDTIIFREFGLHDLSWMNETHQLLWWFVSLRVFVLGMLTGFIYFLIFIKGNFFSAVWEGGIAFVSALVAGYIFVHFGLIDALFAEIAFNFWRIAFASKSSRIV